MYKWGKYTHLTENFTNPHTNFRATDFYLDVFKTPKYKRCFEARVCFRAALTSNSWLRSEEACDVTMSTLEWRPRWFNIQDYYASYETIRDKIFSITKRVFFRIPHLSVLTGYGLGYAGEWARQACALSSNSAVRFYAQALFANDASSSAFSGEVVRVRNWILSTWYRD